MPLSGIAKGGWHPKGKDGGRESWRGDYKGINTVVSNCSCTWSRDLILIRSARQDGWVKEETR